MLAVKESPYLLGEERKKKVGGEGTIAGKRKKATEYKRIAHREFKETYRGLLGGVELTKGVEREDEKGDG